LIPPVIMADPRDEFCQLSAKLWGSMWGLNGDYYCYKLLNAIQEYLTLNEENTRLFIGGCLLASTT